MNITDHKSKSERRMFKDISATELIEYCDVLYMKITEITPSYGVVRNAIRLLDGFSFHFNPCTEVKLVQHELRILS